MIARLMCVPLLLISSMAVADDVPEGEPVAKAAAKSDGGAKMISGMSILGNQEAPKALVIVPWKTSEIGDSLAVSTLLDDSRRPVDKEVFMRELGYYEITVK